MSARPPLWLWHSLCSFYSLNRYLTSLLLNNIMFVFNACHISTLFIFDSDPSAIGHPTQEDSLPSLLALVQQQIVVQSVSQSLNHNDFLHVGRSLNHHEGKTWPVYPGTCPLMWWLVNCTTIYVRVSLIKMCGIMNMLLNCSPPAGSWHHSY